MAIDTPNQDELVDVNPDELTDALEGPIHVSYRAVDSVVEEKRYRLIFKEYKFVKSSKKGTLGANCIFVFDETRHEEYANRKLFETFWIVPGAMFKMRNFLTCAGMNPELFREEEVIDPATGAVKMGPDNRPLTKCVYSVKDQLDSVYGAGVYADVGTEEYEGTAADGVTKEIRRKSVIDKFVKG